MVTLDSHREINSHDKLLIKEALQMTKPYTARQKKSINSYHHETLL